MIGSGILGVWCHHCPAAQPLYFSIFVLFVGNLLYGYAEAFGTHGIYAILVARLLLGFSGGKFLRTNPGFIYLIIQSKIILLVSQKKVPTF